MNTMGSDLVQEVQGGLLEEVMLEPRSYILPDRKTSDKKKSPKLGNKARGRLYDISVSNWNFVEKVPARKSSFSGGIYLVRPSICHQLGLKLEANVQPIAKGQMLSCPVKT